MIENLKVRIVLVVVSIAAAIIYVLPNFAQLPESWIFTKEKLVYGLDIQGGVHLVMGIDTKGIIQEKNLRLGRSIVSELAEKKVNAKMLDANLESKTLQLELENPADAATVTKHIQDSYSSVFQNTEVVGNKLTLRIFDSKIQEFKKHTVEQAIEVIRNRIDEFGVAEPSIAAQGDERILVQLPGIKDSERAKELINRTARLDFQIVSDEIQPADLQKLIEEAETAGSYALGKDDLRYSAYIKRINEDLHSKLPENTRVVFEKAPSAVTLEAGKVPLLVKTDTDLGGDQLEDAFVSFGEFGEPEVIFKFAADGRRRFAEITAANVKKPMAIVLDDVVQSAPIIQDRIDSPTARITLNRSNVQESQNEASFIATALRAGALPAALQQLEERTVGPTLGADSVKKAQKAGLIALVAVLVFLLFYYRRLGFVANVALILNMLFLIALLSSLGATVTLPGIAGIVLTIAMAVDANVIIFERIKEELAKGASVRGALKDGFSNAMSAILDSNITTIITCIILIYFGTGPVRGFGVSLIIGIITSLYTAIFVSRVMLDLMVNKWKMEKLI